MMKYNIINKSDNSVIVEAHPTDEKKKVKTDADAITHKSKNSVCDGRRTDEIVNFNVPAIRCHPFARIWFTNANIVVAIVDIIQPIEVVFFYTTDYAYYTDTKKISDFMIILLK